MWKISLKYILHSLDNYEFINNVNNGAHKPIHWHIYVIAMQKRMWVIPTYH